MPDGSPSQAEPSPLSPEQRFLNYVRFGDKAIIQSLIQEFANRSYSLARRIIGNADGAEDAVQDAYVRLVSTARLYDGSVPFSAWISTLVNNAALDYRRRRAVRQTRVSNMSSKGIAAMEKDDRTFEPEDPPELEALRTALDSLPDRYRAPLTLHYFGGLDRNETAQALGVPTITLAKQLERGLERLRGKLARAGIAVTSAGLISLFSTSPSYSASPTFISSLTATRRLLTVKKMSLVGGSGFFKATVAGALAAVAAITLSTPGKIAPTQGQAAPIPSGAPWAIPGTIEAENYDLGGEGVAYHDVDLVNWGQAFRNDGVDVCDENSGTKIDAFHPGPFVGWTKAGEWLKYSVDVAAPGIYTIDMRVSAWDSGGAFHIEFDGIDKTGPIAMPTHTNGIRQTMPLTWRTLTAQVRLSSGRQAMEIVFDENGKHDFEVANLNYIRLTAASTP